MYIEHLQRSRIFSILSDLIVQVHTVQCTMCISQYLEYRCVPYAQKTFGKNLEFLSDIS